MSSLTTTNRQKKNVFFFSFVRQVSHEWAFCVIVLDLPKYMNDVLHFSIQDNGIYSSIPQLIKLIMALVGGGINDWLIASDHLTITNGRKIFVAIGEFLLKLHSEKLKHKQIWFQSFFFFK